MLRRCLRQHEPQVAQAPQEPAGAQAQCLLWFLSSGLSRYDILRTLTNTRSQVANLILAGQCLQSVYSLYCGGECCSSRDVNGELLRPAQGIQCRC